MNSLNSENKQHYKMYKSGKQWIYAAITTTAVFAGTSMFVSSAVNADTNTQSAVAAPVTGQTTSLTVDTATPKSDVATSTPTAKVDVTNDTTTKAATATPVATDKKVPSTDTAKTTDTTVK